MLKRKFIALLLLACMLASFGLVPNALAASAVLSPVGDPATAIHLQISGMDPSEAVTIKVYYEGNGPVKTINDSVDGSGNGSVQSSIGSNYGNYQVEVIGGTSGTLATSNVLSIPAPAPAPDPDPAPSPTLTSVSLKESSSKKLTAKFSGTPADLAVVVTLYHDGAAIKTVNTTMGAGSQAFSKKATDYGNYQVTVEAAGGLYGQSEPVLTIDPPAPTPDPTSNPTPSTTAIKNVTLTANSARNKLTTTYTGTADAEVKVVLYFDGVAKQTISGVIGSNGSGISSFPIDPAQVGHYQVKVYYANGSSAVTATNLSPDYLLGSVPTDLPAEITNVTLTSNSTKNKLTTTYKGRPNVNTVVVLYYEGSVKQTLSGTINSSGNGTTTFTIDPAATGHYQTKVYYAGGSDAVTATNTSQDFVLSAIPISTQTPTGDGEYPTLYRGMVNGYVSTLQQYLRSLGYYNLRVDGIFGIGTQTAVRNFQLMNGLPATGIADDETQKLLYSGSATGIGHSGGGTSGGGTPSDSALRYGNRGSAVRDLQVRLANLNYYYGSVDGIFGSQTEAAVRNFQSRNNLAVTGVADSSTQNVLYGSSALANSGSSEGYVYLHYGSRGSAVTRLQTALRNAGYYTGPISGQYLDKTYAAVKSFQRANGLMVDGIAGRQTQNKLFGTSY